MSEGFQAYDLGPGQLTRIMVPHATPLRGASHLLAQPRYVPGPLAEGMTRVTLDEDYYLGAGFGDYADGSTHAARHVFEVPQEQRDRWDAARDAWQTAQDEIEALIEARVMATKPERSAH